MAIASHVKFTARAGRGEELVAAMTAMFPTAEQEPGTLVYALHRDRDDPDSVWMYEVYADDDAVEAHGASDAASRLGDVLGDLLDGEPLVAWSDPVRVHGFDLRGG